MTSVDQQRSGWAVEHHWVPSSSRGLSTGGMNSLPLSAAVQAKPIQRGRKHVLLCATWVVSRANHSRYAHKLTQTRSHRMKPTAKYVEVNVYDSRGVIGKFRGAAGAWESELLPVIVERSIHPDIIGQRTVGEFSSKYNHVAFPLYGRVGMASHLQTIRILNKLKGEHVYTFQWARPVHKCWTDSKEANI